MIPVCPSPRKVPSRPSAPLRRSTVGTAMIDERTTAEKIGHIPLLSPSFPRPAAELVDGASGLKPPFVDKLLVLGLDYRLAS